MTDYSSAVIYIITTGDDLYVGSTCNFDNRKKRHKSMIYNPNDRHSNHLLYRKIRQHNGIWNIEIYKDFPCNNRLELRIEEQRVIDELKPTLNEQKAYRTKEEEEAYQKEYREQNINIEYKKKYREQNIEKIRAKANEKITCDCGCKISRTNKKRHRNSHTHINLMNKIDLEKRL